MSSGVSLYGPAPPPTTETTLYTVASPAVAGFLKQVLVTNTTALQHTVSLSLVRSGGSASTANRILNQIPIGPNGVVPFDLFIYLLVGDFLSGLQDTAAAINLTITGFLVP